MYTEWNIEHKMNGISPSEIILVKTRNVAFLSDEEIIKQAWEDHTEADSSEFWRRNLYPTNSKFLVYDIEKLGMMYEERDSFKFWMALVTLAGNDISSDVLQPHRLYKLNTRINGKKLTSAFQDKIISLNMAELEITRSMEKGKYSIHDDGMIPDYKMEVPVNFHSIGNSLGVKKKFLVRLDGGIKTDEEERWNEYTTQAYSSVKNLIKQVDRELEYSALGFRDKCEYKESDVKLLDIYAEEDLRNNMRDYMRYNRQLFMTDAKAIPTICSGYSKTQRNVVLKLVLMMADFPVDEDTVTHELELLGIQTDDVYTELMKLIDTYTEISDSLITVKNRQLPGDDLLPKRKREYYITKETFDRYFSKTIKNAFFVVEDENKNREIIDAKLFGHITQLVMPKQIIVHDGKAYRVVRCTPKVGCVLHRASDSYNERLYYKQLRRYHMENINGVVSSRTVYDLGIVFEAWTFSVDTNGYLELKDNNDLRSARVVDLSGDPSISNYYRRYVDKNVLKLILPDTDKEVRFTIGILLSELFRSLFKYNTRIS